ncbi:MAG: DUF2818 family protein [Burkholderiales bacterium]|nr:DUF2818 family protein [Burkholderiales bacterium]
MDAAFSGWLVILMAVAAANLPFMNERLFAFIPLHSAALSGKPLWIRLIELFVFYLLTGCVAYLLEARIGNAFVQGWEFYAVTACLFIVLAYPGFVFRYLRKDRH